MAFLFEYSVPIFMNMSEKLQSPERRTSKNVSLSFNLFRISCQTQFPSFPALLPPSAAGNLGISLEVWASQLVMACFLAHRKQRGHCCCPAVPDFIEDRRENGRNWGGRQGSAPALLPATSPASELPQCNTFPFFL